MSVILDGHDILGGGMLDGIYGQRLQATARTRGVMVPPLNSIAEDAPPLYARVQSGPTEAGTVAHWVVTCDCGCASTSFVWLDTPLVLFVRCWNRAWRKRWRPVVVPDPEMRAEIDRLLSLRPVRNRWWNPTETVLDLLAENEAQGVGV